MEIYLYNTRSKRKEAFRPGNPAHVTLYVCGPTVYNYAHIGNARPAVVFDVLSRLLRHRYPKLTYVRNFTDVDDKINAVALEQGVPISEITSKYILAYHEDMAALDVQEPDVAPRVTEHIDDIIQMVSKLIRQNHAYEANGHVLFHVPSFAEYGQLSGKNRDEMIAGARVEISPFKSDPSDFVLWKPSTPELPGWESPWGRGRPGWHIECTAMIERHLGNTIDLHGGGQDLIFPHHENEIAQGTCAHGGEQYCRYWVHNGFITVNGRKMSKSLGNILLVRDLLKQFDGETLRLAMLMTHYRHSMDWNDQTLNQAKQSLNRFYRAIDTLDDSPQQPAEHDWGTFLAKLGNDLNTPEAIAILHGWAKEALGSPDAKRKGQLKTLFREAANLLGIMRHVPQQALEIKRHQAGVDDGTRTKIENLIAQRLCAKQSGDYAKADDIRQALSKMNVILKDHVGQTTWEIAE